MTESEKSRFPKVWNCPKCGSERERLTQVAFKETHNGKAPASTKTRAEVLKMELPGDIVPYYLVILWDFCWECGTEYAYRAEIPEVHIKMAESPVPEGLLPNLNSRRN